MSWFRGLSSRRDDRPRQRLSLVSHVVKSGDKRKTAILVGVVVRPSARARFHTYVSSHVPTDMKKWPNL